MAMKLILSYRIMKQILNKIVPAGLLPNPHNPHLTVTSVPAHITLTTLPIILPRGNTGWYHYFKYHTVLYSNCQLGSFTSCCKVTWEKRH